MPEICLKNSVEHLIVPPAIHEELFAKRSLFFVAHSLESFGTGRIIDVDDRLRSMHAEAIERKLRS